MKSVALTVLFTLLLAGAATGQTVTLYTQYGASAANADRVMVSGLDGRWREVAGVDGTYLVEPEGSRYSLAVTCFTDSGPHVTVYRFLVDELPALRHVCRGRSDVLADVVRFEGVITPASGATSGLQSVAVQLGSRPLHAGALQGPTRFSASVVAGQAADLLALYGPLGGAPTLGLLERQVHVTDVNSDWFDFTSPSALELEHHLLSFTGTERVTLNSYLVTCSGARAQVGAAVVAGTAEARFAALPAAAREECDRYELTAFATDAEGTALRLTTAMLAEPASRELTLPAPVGSPVIETVGAEPLRARLSWAAEPGVLYYLGGLTDGRITWSFVQSALLAPSITLPPWGADLAAPEVRGGSFTWSFGAVRSEFDLEQVLHAYGQNSVTGHGEFWGPTEPGLEYQLHLHGGPWAPHATEPSGGR